MVGVRSKGEVEAGPVLTSSGCGEAGARAGHHVDISVTRTSGRIQRSREAAGVTVHRVGDTIGRSKRGRAPGPLVQERPPSVYRLPLPLGSGGEAVGGGGGGWGQAGGHHLYDGGGGPPGALDARASEQAVGQGGQAAAGAGDCSPLQCSGGGGQGVIEDELVCTAASLLLKKI